MKEFFSALWEAWPGATILRNSETGEILLKNSQYIALEAEGKLPEILEKFRPRETRLRGESGTDLLLQFWEKQEEKKEAEILETTLGVLQRIVHDLNNSFQSILVFGHLGKDLPAKMESLPMFQNYAQKIYEAVEISREQLHRLDEVIQIPEENQGKMNLELNAFLRDSWRQILGFLKLPLEGELQTLDETIFWETNYNRFLDVLREILTQCFDLSLPPESLFLQIAVEKLEHKRKVQLRIRLVEAPLKLNQTFHFWKLRLESWNWNLEPLGEDSYLLELPVYPSSPPYRFASKKSPWETLQRKVIWVVDDEALSLESVGEVLQRKNLKPLLFSSAKKALESRPYPDCLISDWNLEKENGWKLAETIRKEKPDCAVILFSGSFPAQARNQGSDLNTLFREKPLSVTELEETLLLAFGLL